MCRSTIRPSVPRRGAATRDEDLVRDVSLVEAVEPGALFVDQRLGRGSRRSNPAAYSGVLDAIVGGRQRSSVPRSLVTSLKSRQLATRQGTRA